MSPELFDLIFTNRELRRELQRNIKVRAEIARSFHLEVKRLATANVVTPDMRIVSMTALLLDAHKLAVAEQNGLTIDVITDALEHLQQRLENEVLPSFAEQLHA